MRDPIQVMMGRQTAEAAKLLIDGEIGRGAIRGPGLERVTQRLMGMMLRIGDDRDTVAGGLLRILDERELKPTDEAVDTAERLADGWVALRDEEKLCNDGGREGPIVSRSRARPGII